MAQKFYVHFVMIVLAVLTFGIGIKLHPTLISLFLLMIAFILGGYSKIKEALVSLFLNRQFDAEVLMLVSSVGACFLGYEIEGVLLIIIFGISGVIEEYINYKTSQKLEEVVFDFSEKIDIIRNNQQIQVNFDELKVDDILLVKVGDRVLADGYVLSQEAIVDNSGMTGESVPQNIFEGGFINAGCINMVGLIQVKIIKDPKESAFFEMTRIIEKAKESRNFTQKKVEGLQKYYVYLVFMASLLTLIVPYFIGLWSFKESIYRSLIILVVASPCALLVSSMPVYLVGLGVCAKNNILVKSCDALETLGKINVLAVDKTRTMTLGKLEVAGYYFIDNVDQTLMHHLVYNSELVSSHPCALALLNFLDKPETINLKDLKEISGFGVSFYYLDDYYQIGKFACDNNGLEENLNKLYQDGYLVISVIKNEKLIGYYYLADKIRPEASEMVVDSQCLGVDIMMISGDHQLVVNRVCKELNIDLGYGQCLPADKVKYIKDLKSQGKKVAMLGDGLNDSLALIESDVAISIDDGLAVAKDNADIIFWQKGISQWPWLLRRAKYYNSLVKMNLLFAMLVIVCLIVSNWLQILTLPMGVFFHETSTIIVLLNGLRALFYK